MKRLIPVLAALILLASCQPAKVKQELVQPLSTFKLFSADIKDSFIITVSLPNSYFTDKGRKYPVVYVTDANFYFDIFSTITNRYSQVGLLPEAILVGIGYKDLKTMDSHRDRDFTYPAAAPEDSFIVSGGGEKFLAFIKHTVIPEIDSRYACDTTRRVLTGHSLGGFFSLYALKQQLQAKDKTFCAFIAGSPELAYHHYELVDQLAALQVNNDTSHTVKLYMNYGGMEDTEEADERHNRKNAILIQTISAALAQKQPSSVKFKGEMISNLSHMDTGIPGYIRGMQWAFYGEF